MRRLALGAVPCTLAILLLSASPTLAQERSATLIGDSANESLFHLTVTYVQAICT